MSQKAAFKIRCLFHTTGTVRECCPECVFLKSTSPAYSFPFLLTVITYIGFFLFSLFSECSVQNCEITYKPHYEIAIILYFSRTVQKYKLYFFFLWRKYKNRLINDISHGQLLFCRPSHLVEMNQSCREIIKILRVGLCCSPKKRGGGHGIGGLKAASHRAWGHLEEPPLFKSSSDTRLNEPGVEWGLPAHTGGGESGKGQTPLCDIHFIIEVSLK